MYTIRYMPLVFQSFIVLGIILLLARFIKRGSGVLQKFFIPSSLVAGIGGLVLGPQILNTVPAEITNYWAMLPKHLITIVFAGLFLGKIIPSRKEIWKQGAPMLAFGNVLAWGQYVVGIAITMFILTPFFGTNPLAGALIELSFEGGHGTAAGLAPTFEQLGWSEGTDIALGLATFSIIVAIVAGIFFINWHSRRHGVVTDEETWKKQRRQMIRSGYNLISFSKKVQTNPKIIAINLAAFAIAIGIGWLLLKGLIITEDMVLNGFTDIRFFTYLPLFPLAMIGGLIVQIFLRKIGKQTLVQRRTAEIISAIALDVLIASAVATVSLSVIGDNLVTFSVLAIAGVVWILGCFLFLAPRMFSRYWFENGLTNTGQSMGMTATGLLLNRLVDPSNHTKAREGFAYKQLVFEPFMGGGIVTAGAAIVIHEAGSAFALISALIVTIFWLILGLKLKQKRQTGSHRI